MLWETFFINFKKILPMLVIYIMKTMCPNAYQHNGFELTHAFGHMMYGCAIMCPGA